MIRNGYDVFKNRITQLIKHFKIEVEDGEITPQKEDLIRAFILLSHAEIENYIEDLALNLIKKGKEKWGRDYTANYHVASLFIYMPQISTNQNVVTKSYRHFSEFEKIVSHNHGIKEENIKKLFEPLGYSIDDFDASFINDLSSLGATRGQIAHTSVSSVQRQLDPKEEKDKINRLVEGIEGFEKVLIEKIEQLKAVNKSKGK